MIELEKSLDFAEMLIIKGGDEPPETYPNSDGDEDDAYGPL